MSGNTFGTSFRVTTFGESHGQGLGVIIDGCPSGVSINIETIQKALNRRKPGATTVDENGKTVINPSVTSRKEPDTVEILSGVFENKSTGTPIALLIRNTSQHSSDYTNIAQAFRPGHADYTYTEKYGFRDYRGGGRSSGRETVARVAAGAIAEQMLTQSIAKHYPALPAPQIIAYTTQAAGIEIETRDFSVIEKNSLRCPDMEAAKKMEGKIAEYRKEGNSCGGIVECQAMYFPTGLGEPVFDKLDALLAHAMLSIGAVKGIEFGAGFKSADMSGATWNDAMNTESDYYFSSNNCGGILGGLSNGSPIVFRVGIKPVPSIYLPQKTINTHKENVTIQIEGRHDICLCPRIIPVIEAMTWITLADCYLQNRNSQL